MTKEKIKVYLYTRVSTTMQIDGYSLDAQKTKMKAFCDYNEYEIAGVHIPQELQDDMPWMSFGLSRHLHRWNLQKVDTIRIRGCKNKVRKF